MEQERINMPFLEYDNLLLDEFLQEIGREDLITFDEEIELAQRIHNGDKAALKKLVRANVRFVVAVAAPYQREGLTLAELINAGTLGLIKAAEEFDENCGKFISYAVERIRQSILQALAEQSTHCASADTIKASEHPTFPDAPFVENEDNSLPNVMDDENSPKTDRVLIDKSLSKEIERTLSILTEREHEIVKKFFGIGMPEMTLEEIGEEFGLIPGQVRQMKEDAIRRLSSSSKSKLLKTYLDIQNHDPTKEHP